MSTVRSHLLSQRSQLYTVPPIITKVTVIHGPTYYHKGHSYTRSHLLSQRSQLYTVPPIITKVATPIYPTLNGPDTGGNKFVRVPFHPLCCSHKKWLFIVLISFICWCILFHFNQNFAPDRKIIPAPRENYPVPDPTRFLDPGPDRSPV